MEFSTDPALLAHTPTNTIHQARFGAFKFLASGYDIAGAEAHSISMELAGGVRATFSAPMGWTNSPHKVRVREGAKLTLNGAWGQRYGNLYPEIHAPGEIIMNKDMLNMNFENGSGDWFFTMGSTNRISAYMRLAHGYPNIRTGGAALGIGPANKIVWETMYMHLGGPGSGDITISSRLEANWWSGKSLYVDGIAARVDDFRTDCPGANAWANLRKRGGGTLIFYGESSLSQRYTEFGLKDCNGLSFDIENGARRRRIAARNTMFASGAGSVLDAMETGMGVGGAGSASYAAQTACGIAAARGFCIATMDGDVKARWNRMCVEDGGRLVNVRTLRVGHSRDANSTRT